MLYMPDAKGYVKKGYRNVYQKARSAIDKRYGLPGKKVNWNQIGQDIMWLKNSINSEKKQKTFNVESTIISHDSANGHYVYALQGPAQSLKEDGRVGNQYKLTSIEVQLDVFNGVNQIDVDNSVHIFFFQILGDQLSGTDGQGGTIANRLFDDNNSGRIKANSFRNQESYKQCRILNYKRVYFRNTDSSLTAGNGNKARKEMKFWLNLKKGSPYQHFEKDQPSSTDVNKNKIYMLMISDLGSSVIDPGATANLAYRINYVDN